MAKKFTYRGKTFEEIESLSFEEFVKMLPSRQRRSLAKGVSKKYRRFLEKVKAGKNSDKLIRTQYRDMIILPEMVGAKIGIHNGKEYHLVMINEAMIGHFLGEFAMTRKKVSHSSPGFGATRSSKFVPLK